MQRLTTLLLITLLASRMSFAAHTSAADDNATVEHSTFTTFDWQELRIDSLLPTYTEVIPLDTDYRMHEYRVELSYPQFAPLSREETIVATRFNNRIGEDINIDTHVGIMRRVGMLDVSFCPIVKRNGKYMKLLSAQINVIATPIAQPSRIAMTKVSKCDTSRLATGRWVKIAITEDGMYRLTRNTLRQMGFTQPENVHLYGYGGHRLSEVITQSSHYDDLPEVPLYYNKEKDCWLFWGNGLVHWNGNVRILNHYSRTAYYFLHQEESPSVIATNDAENITPEVIVNTTTAHELYERDQYAYSQYGRNLFDATNFSASPTQNYKIQTVNSRGEERLDIYFSSGAKTTTTMTPSVNGSKLRFMTLPAYAKYEHGTTASLSYDIAQYAQGDTWNITLTSTAGNEAHLDYIALHYKQLLTPHRGFVTFTSYTPKATRFDIAGKGLQVMRLGTPSQEPALISGSQNNDIYSILTSSPSDNYVAFDPNYEFPQPVYTGTVENQNLHALDSIDMLIIVPTSGKLIAQAQRLADAHAAHDGLRSAIVRADQIYNEFSSGTPDATAYRLLLKRLYDRANGDYDGPRYLLLMGDAAWDNRMLSSLWRNQSPEDYLLCYESENSMSSTKSYVMEDYFGLLDDNEGGNLLKDKADIGIGRFPVTTESQARLMVDKCIAYLENRHPGAWRNLVCMLGDDGDNNEHMRFINDVAQRISVEQPDVELRKVMWDAYDRVSSSTGLSYPMVTKQLKKQMSDGAAVINYMGHANAYALSHEFVLYKEDFAANKTDRLGLWYTGACDVMPFDGCIENTGETAVLTPDGGALAFVGTARTVYATQNLHLNRFFMRYLFASDANSQRYRLGDALRLAKNAVIDADEEGSFAENKLQYALLGDPALVIGAPQQKVVLDSINGLPIGKDIQMLQAGDCVTLCGHIADISGQPMPAFDGTITANIYDNKQLITCFNHARAESAFQFEERNLVYSGTDSIRGGEFRLSFVVPIDNNYSEQPGRIVFYAANKNGTMEANGHNEDFAFGGMSEQIKNDSIGPVIAMYLNQNDFQSGDVVNSTPCLIAQLEDESGISTMGNGIGHDLTICVDNRADMTYNANEAFTAEFGNYKRGTLAYNIPDLADGPHSLTLRAWDVLGNTSMKQLDFIVDARKNPEILTIAATENPALTQTTFVVSTNRPGSECSISIDVFDFMGRLVWNHTELTTSSTGLFMVPWRLTNGEGGRLGTGIYLYRATLQCGKSRQVTKSQKIIVLNNK